MWSEDIFRNFGLVGIFDTTLLQVSAGAFQQPVDLALHAGSRQVQLGLGHQCIHNSLFIARQQAKLDLAFEILLDIGAQTFNRCVCNTQGFGQCLIDFWQMSGFNLLERHHEVSGFACDIFTVVIRRKGQLEGLAFASLHATRRLFKLFEHLAIAYDELEVIGFSASENFTVDLAFKVNHHAVALLRSRVLSPLRKSAALLAQNVKRFIDRGVGYFGSYFFNFSGRQVTYFDFWKDFKDRI